MYYESSGWDNINISSGWDNINIVQIAFQKSDEKLSPDISSLVDIEQSQTSLLDRWILGLSGSAPLGYLKSRRHRHVSEESARQVDPSVLWLLRAVLFPLPRVAHAR
uniref:Uncharacterized protein n=1 Tax=Steinernema glaseri TaxID=37863 RepID=A0A1I7YU02_9BILA